MTVLNTNLMRHPLNWLTLWIMAFFFFYVGHLLISYFSGQHPGAVGALNTSGIVGPGTADPSATI